ncbi:methyltransferase-like protein 27 [Montipora foliosa]|uniref:methyltransferase-like protein 27 n=1 Tax=Montipora foliosa TaxID=591990 RepID=UPI0035F1F9E6
MECGGQEYNCNKHEKLEELLDFYKKAAADYDKDVKVLRGYVGHETSVNIFANTLKQCDFAEDAKILDVGAGTGLVGEELSKRNFTNIDALDASLALLDKAEKKGIYKQLFVDVLGPGKCLNLKDNCYDAAIAVGVFTLNHVKADGAMDEMARVVRPGGLVCFSIREDVAFKQEYGYQEKMEQLCQEQVWKLVSQTKEQYHSKNDFLKCYLYIYQVL